MARTRAAVSLAPIVAGAARGDDADETTTRILDAIESLLADYGLRRWSVDDVVVRSGVGRTTVYRKFAGRDDLVHAVLARELRRTIAVINGAVAGHEALEDRIVEGGLVALGALRDSLVERLLHSDPATFVPFLTTGAGPLIALARQLLVGSVLRDAPAAVDTTRASEAAEAAARLGLSFILTRDTVFPLDDADQMRASLRAVVRPVLAQVAAS
jgi:AcrR family transcriptional regulator